MKKFIYIIFLIIGVGTIGSSCNTIRVYSKMTQRKYFNKLIPNKTYGDVRVYWKDTVYLLSDIYLILKPIQSTYEYYSEWDHNSEIGTYEQKKDTLFMTPRLSFRNRGPYKKWDYREMPNTDTSIFVADDGSIKKTFLVKDDGDYLIDLTTYYIVNDNREIVPSTPHTKYFFNIQSPWAEITPLGKK